MDLGIAGKRALVCAASKGLGRGCALALARQCGARAALHVEYFFDDRHWLRRRRCSRRPARRGPSSTG